MPPTLTPLLFATAALFGNLAGPVTQTPVAGIPAGPLAQGDAAWEERAAGGGDETDPKAVQRALDAYAEAVEEHPESLEARWKQLRALYFQARYVAPGELEKRRLWESGRDLAEVALDRLGRRAGGRELLDEMSPEERTRALERALDEDGAGMPAAAEIYFWSAVHWGQWGDTVGSLKAARQGLAGKLRDLAETVVAVDETVEGAGGHRFLGRLHAEAPKIPFFTGWVDRDLALRHLRRALELAPEEPDNALFLAAAILEHRPSETAEALGILRRLAERRPRPGHRVEDAQSLAEARRLLAAEDPAEDSSEDSSEVAADPRD